MHSFPLIFFVIYISERKPCNNRRPRCDIEWLHVTNHLYHGFVFDC